MAAWLLSLVLCLSSVGDLLAGSPALQGPLSFAGEICRAAGADHQPDDSSQPRTAHDCCITGHLAQIYAAVPPSVALIGPVSPWSGISFAPVADAPLANISARHKNARAPPLA